ncbi:MAG: DNA primase [Myxococcota bacterium]
MAHPIPSEVVAQVRERADLLDLVQRYVRLERKGRRHVGLCPFHSEKSPSFGVSPEKQLFHCFGCQEGGDIFAFLMKIEGLSFPEVVRQLAKEVGVDVPEPERSPRELEAERRREAQLKSHELAADFFRRALAKDDRALDYLETHRGVGPAARERFALGFAPDSWDALATALDKRRLGRAGLESGLLGERRQGGRPYSKFRGRIMFPIRRPDGRVAAFGARRCEWIDPDGPKYLNSAESPIYDKSGTLYGLFEGQKSMRQRHQAILTEGYLDVIALHQAGFEQAVAACGTALTGRHAERLRRWVREVVTAYDGDAAGREATRKAALPLLAAGLNIRVLQLPRGEDPDTFIRQSGPEAFGALLDAAPSIFDHLVQEVRSTARGGGIAGATAAMDALRPLLDAIPDPLKKDVALAATARALEVHSNVLRRHLTLPRARSGARPEPPPPASSPPAQGASGPKFRVSVVEAGILRALLDRPAEMIDALESRNGLDAFSSMAFQAAVGSLVEFVRAGGALTGPRIIDALVEAGMESGVTELRARLVEDLPEQDDPSTLVDRLVERNKKARLRELRRRIESAPSSKERERLEAELLVEATRTLAG